jgi:hypothetical protein
MSERALQAGLVAASAFAVCYLLPGTLQLPSLFYDPLQGAFLIARARPAPAMRYYGDLLYATVGALAAFAVALRFLKGPVRLPVATATALSLVALDALYYLSRFLAAV